MMPEPSPEHTLTLDTGSLTPEQSLAAGVAAARKLHLDVSWAGSWTFMVSDNRNKDQPGKNLFFRMEADSAKIQADQDYPDQDSLQATQRLYANTFDEIRRTVSPGQLEQLFHRLEYEDGSAGHVPAQIDSAASILSFFKPRKGYFITPLLIDANIVVFIFMVIMGVGIVSPDSESLIRWGANFKPLTLGGQGWRLLTNCFLHIGIFHLLMNMYALLYIGLLLEPFLGRLNFLVAYVLTGLMASLASLWWHDIIVSAGASGAIFGMYGVFLALLTTNLIEKEARTKMLSSIGIFVGYNLLFGLSAGVDNAAHIGGLLSGIIIGYATYAGIHRRASSAAQAGIAAVLSVIVVSTCMVAVRKMPNDIGLYQQKIEEFSRLEKTALKVYEKGPGTPKEVMLRSIRDSGIRYWDQSITLLQGAGKLHLPEAYRQRNGLLLRYSKLRKEAFGFLYRSVAEGTDKYRDSITERDKEIEKIMLELKK